jgi:hypothetical protein
MDKARAKKTLDFKTKMISEPVTKILPSQSISNTLLQSAAQVENKVLFEIYNEKDNLFNEK